MHPSMNSERLGSPQILESSKSVDTDAIAFTFPSANGTAVLPDVEPVQPLTKSQSAQSPHALTPRTPANAISACSKSSVRVFEGGLLKRGKVNKSWKERWFVMTLDFRLNYYETEAKSRETFTVKNNRNMLGSIDLLTVEKIEVSLIKETAAELVPTYFRILPSDKDDRGYLIHLVTSSRIFKLSAASSEWFVRWLRALHEHLHSGTIFESHLRKKGEVNKAWKRRYFVLNKYKQLKYYNNQRRELLYGFIDVNEAHITFSAQEQCIVLTTEKRMWQLKCEAVDLFREWSAFLSDIDDNEEVRKAKYMPVYQATTATADTATTAPTAATGHDIAEGDILAMWMAAQREIAQGVMPTVLSDAGFALKELGRPRKTISTVTDIQQLLNERTSVVLSGHSLVAERRSVMDAEAADSSDDEELSDINIQPWDDGGDGDDDEPQPHPPQEEAYEE